MKSIKPFCIGHLKESGGSSAKPVDRIRRSRAYRRQEGDPLFGGQAHRARLVAPCSTLGRHGVDTPAHAGYTDMWAD